MHRLMLQGMEDLLVGIVIPIILSTASTIVYLVIHGWKGVAHAFSTWSIACFMGVLCHWGCQHYGVPGTMSALLISMTALLSHAILDVIFHPRLRKAIVARLSLEIRTRGRLSRKAGSDGQAD